MRNLTRTYIVALSIIALVISASQFLVQRSIYTSSVDSRVINISGRQRMLSQKITKASLAMSTANTQQTFDQRKEELAGAYNLWSTSHYALQEGNEEMEMTNVNNSETVLGLYAEMQPLFVAIEGGVKEVLAYERPNEVSDSVFQASIEPILLNEGEFLRIMNAIVFQYDAEASGRVSTLSSTEYVLYGIALILLILEALIIFRPAINRLYQYTKELVEKEKNLQEALGQQQYLTNQAEGIFETVQQGIFLLDKDLIIDSFYSRETEEIFSEDELSGQSMLKLMKSRLLARDLEALELYVENLFNTEIREEVVNRLNPLEQVEIFSEGENKEIQSRFLKVTFSRIMRGDSIYRILVTVLDETESVLMKRQIEESEERNRTESNQLLAILRVNPGSLQGYLDDTISKLESISREFESNQSDDYSSLISHAFNMVHSAKGNATLIELELIEEKLHKVEDSITHLRNKKEVEGRDFLKVVYEVTEVLGILSNMKEMLEQIKNVYGQLNTEQGQFTSNKVFISTIRKGVDRLSDQFGKPADFKFIDNGILIPEAYKIDIKDMIIQLVRNSIIHGIEEQDERQFSGKRNKAVIQLKLDKDAKGDLVVSYQDDGRGLDLQKIATKAVKEQIVSKEELKSMQPQEVASLIFSEGLSTSDKVDELSGRGQGMNIVKTVIDKYDSKYKLYSKKGRYFGLDVVLPFVESNTLKQAV